MYMLYAQGDTGADGERGDEGLRGDKVSITYHLPCAIQIECLAYNILCALLGR